VHLCLTSISITHWSSSSQAIQDAVRQHPWPVLLHYWPHFVLLDLSMGLFVDQSVEGKKAEQINFLVSTTAETHKTRDSWQISDRLFCTRSTAVPSTSSAVNLTPGLTKWMIVVDTADEHTHGNSGYWSAGPWCQIFYFICEDNKVSVICWTLTYDQHDADVPACWPKTALLRTVSLTHCKYKLLFQYSTVSKVAKFNEIACRLLHYHMHSCGNFYA